MAYRNEVVFQGKVALAPYTGESKRGPMGFVKLKQPRVNPDGEESEKRFVFLDVACFGPVGTKLAKLSLDIGDSVIVEGRYNSVATQEDGRWLEKPQLIATSIKRCKISGDI